MSFARVSSLGLSIAQTNMDLTQTKNLILTITIELRNCQCTRDVPTNVIFACAEPGTTDSGRASCRVLAKSDAMGENKIEKIRKIKVCYTTIKQINGTSTITICGQQLHQHRKQYTNTTLPQQRKQVHNFHHHHLMINRRRRIAAHKQRFFNIHIHIH